MVFWDKAYLPIRKRIHCVEKLEYLYENLITLQKSTTRPAQKEKQDDFKDQFDELFYIAPQKVLDNLEVSKEAKRFFINQRKKGREGSLAPVKTYPNKLDVRSEDCL